MCSSILCLASAGIASKESLRSRNGGLQAYRYANSTSTVLDFNHNTSCIEASWQGGGHAQKNGGIPDGQENSQSPPLDRNNSFPGVAVAQHGRPSWLLAIRIRVVRTLRKAASNGGRK